VLTLQEKILFLLALLASTLLTWRGVWRLKLIIARGDGELSWKLIPRRLTTVLLKTLSFTPVFRSRPITSTLHGLVGWGFAFYLLINIGDLLQGFIPGLVFLGHGWIGNAYRLLADVLSVAECRCANWDGFFDGAPVYSAPGRAADKRQHAVAIQGEAEHQTRFRHRGFLHPAAYWVSLSGGELSPGGICRGRVAAVCIRHRTGLGGSHFSCRPGDRPACSLVDGVRVHSGLPALLSAIQTHPSFLRSTQLPAPSRMALYRRIGTP